MVAEVPSSETNIPGSNPAQNIVFFPPEKNNNERQKNSGSQTYGPNIHVIFVPELRKYLGHSLSNIHWRQSLNLENIWATAVLTSM